MVVADGDGVRSGDRFGGQVAPLDLDHHGVAVEPGGVDRDVGGDGGGDHVAERFDPVGRGHPPRRCPVAGQIGAAAVRIGPVGWVGHLAAVAMDHVSLAGGFGHVRLVVHVAVGLEPVGDQHLGQEAEPVVERGDVLDRTAQGHGGGPVGVGAYLLAIAGVLTVEQLLAAGVLCGAKAADDGLELGGGGMVGPGQQQVFGHGDRDAGDGSDLGVRQGPVREPVPDLGEVAETERDPDVFTGGGGSDAEPPRQPHPGGLGALVGPDPAAYQLAEQFDPAAHRCGDR